MRFTVRSLPNVHQIQAFLRGQFLRNTKVRGQQYSASSIPPQQRQAASHNPLHEPQMRLDVVGLVPPAFRIVPMAVHDINAAKLPPTAPSRTSMGLTGVSLASTGFFGVSRPDDTSSGTSALAQPDVVALGRRHAPLDTTMPHLRVAARLQRRAEMEVHHTYQQRQTDARAQRKEAAVARRCAKRSV